MWTEKPTCTVWMFEDSLNIPYTNGTDMKGCHGFLGQWHERSEVILDCSVDCQEGEMELAT